MSDQTTDAEPRPGLAMLVECPHCGTRVLPLPGRSCPSCRRHLDAPPDRDVIVESDEVRLASRKLARRLLRGRLPVAEVRQNLLDRGLHPDAVEPVVREAAQDLAAAGRKAGRRLIDAGYWCCAFGILGGLAVLFASGAIITDRPEGPVLTIVVGLGLIAWGTARSHRDED